tara:strand:+ start:356 stop:631 length:276 start_codon:yes stop_codon:yes gene_type:complete
MLVELVEVTTNDYGGCSISKILVNPRHIVTVREDTETQQLISEGKLSLGLVQSAVFSKLKLNERGGTTTLTVVGSPSEIQAKAWGKQVLRG